MEKAHANMIFKGLSLFIGDVRNCQSKEQERATVLKEMAKIRQQFLRRDLSTYERKKYVWKLIYAHILGYPVDFGHDIAINLVNESKFTDKTTGYIAMGIMLNERSDFALFGGCLDAIKSDLTSRNEARESLALSTLGNIGSAELARELSPAILHKALSSDHSISVTVRKKACACLLSLLRRERLIYNASVGWCAEFSELLKNTNYGVLLSGCALIQGVL